MKSGVKNNPQTMIAIASFVAAVAFSLAGFIVEPLGDLTDANLYLVAQFLLVTTSLFGVSSIVSKSFRHNATNQPHHHSLLGSSPEPNEFSEGD